MELFYSKDKQNYFINYIIEHGINVGQLKKEFEDLKSESIYFYKYLLDLIVLKTNLTYEHFELA